MTYTFPEFARHVEEYARMVANKAADTDLTLDTRAEVVTLLRQTVPNLTRQDPEGVDPRRVAIAHARSLGLSIGFSQPGMDRAIDILSNL